MSYDVRIGDFESNMTSNIGAVFYDHMPDGLPGLHGLTGAECRDRWDIFWRNIAETRRRMWSHDVAGERAMEAKYNAPNGWGSLVGALIWAGEMTAACARHPRHKFHVYY